MKISIISLLVYTIATSFAYAQEYPFWGLKMPSAAVTPAIYLVKEADVLVANVTIVASKRDPAEQAADFAKGIEVLRNTISKNPVIIIKDARTVFGGGEPSAFASSYAAGNSTPTAARQTSNFSILSILEKTLSPPLKYFAI